MDKTSEKSVMNFIKAHLDDIPYKTLRINEVELTSEEKLTKMEQLLLTDPGLFLSKWGNYLGQDILRLFKSIQGNYEVDYLLDSLLYEEPMDESDGSALANINDDDNMDIFENRRPRKPKSALNTLTRNRRYEYLKQYLRSSDYFSEESMQLREPVLYEQFIGQHIPIKERDQPFSNTTGLVDRILSNIDRKYVSDHLERQKVRDEEQFEEEEEDSDDEEEEDDDDDEILERSTPALISKSKQKDVNMKDVKSEKENQNMEEDKEKKEGDEEEDEEKDEEEDMAKMAELAEFREEQRLELIRLLEEKFLAGKDDTFDYMAVDYNEEYDDLAQQEQDIQDKYFDED